MIYIYIPGEPKPLEFFGSMQEPEVYFGKYKKPSVLE
jgi:hypothetical protein